VRLQAARVNHWQSCVPAHEVALLRTEKALASLDAILQQAQASGDLKRFNATYKARRLRATAMGDKFMSYQTAREKLQRALVLAIASESQGQPFTFAMHRVFEQQSR